MLQLFVVPKGLTVYTEIPQWGSIVCIVSQQVPEQQGLWTSPHCYFSLLCTCLSTHTHIQVVQIFYPFSLQVYPNAFPGSSVDDCPRDSTREE